MNEPDFIAGFGAHDLVRGKRILSRQGDTDIGLVAKGSFCTR
ncbi:hypothetical protein [Vibrio sp. CAU 1672]|nr:hypothetical protein [Vibrio sp. CAU 1672]MDF2154283.1 hypothetical protein [Vibrio sp. CAU 1672]